MLRTHLDNVCPPKSLCKIVASERCAMFIPQLPAALGTTLNTHQGGVPQHKKPGVRTEEPLEHFHRAMTWSDDRIGGQRGKWEGPEPGGLGGELLEEWRLEVRRLSRSDGAGSEEADGRRGTCQALPNWVWRMKDKEDSRTMCMFPFLKPTNDQIKNYVLVTFPFSTLTNRKLLGQVTVSDSIYLYYLLWWST